MKHLPDKGKRIEEYHDKLIVEIEKRNVFDRAAELFSELNIASKGKKLMDNLEWNGKTEGIANVDQYLDSDDDIDDIDPLKIIAQSRDDVKRVKVIPPEPTLITPEDLKEIESFKVEIFEGAMKNKHKLMQIIPDSIASPLTRSTSELSVGSGGLPDLDPHINYLCSKENAALPPPQKFKPYFTTTSNSLDPSKEKLRHKHTKWEITAATPPPLQHQEAKVLSLHESIALQLLHQEQLKTIQEKQAVERLKAKEIRLMGSLETKSTDAFTTFRIPKNDVSDEDDDDDSDGNYDNAEDTWEDQEVHDDVGPGDGGVSIVQYEP